MRLAPFSGSFHILLLFITIDRNHNSSDILANFARELLDGAVCIGLWALLSWRAEINRRRSHSHGTTTRSQSHIACWSSISPIGKGMSEVP